MLVYATFEALKSACSINRWHGIDADMLRSPEAFALAAQDLSGRIGWGAAYFVFLLAWAVTLAGTAATIVSAARNWDWRRRSIVAAFGVLFLIVPFRDLRGSLTVSGMVGVFEVTYEALNMSPEGPLLMHLASSLSVQAALVLALGAGVCLTRSGSGRDAAQVLEERTRRLKLILYLGAAFLVSGTVENLAMHHLPVPLAGPGEQEGLRTIAQAVSGGTGTFWTVLLMAIYLPPALLLRAHAGRLALEGVARGEARDAEEWLKVRRLSSSVAQQARQVLALLGPFLVGVPGSKVMELLGAGG